MEDMLFAQFFEVYGSTFTEQQAKSWKVLRQRLEEYYDKLPNNSDPQAVLNDPDWEKVRQVAKNFVEAFGS